MRKLYMLMVIGLALVSVVGCGKPADKKPSWEGAPVTETKPATGAAGEAAENLPKPKAPAGGDVAPGAPAAPGGENLPGQGAPAQRVGE